MRAEARRRRRLAAERRPPPPETVYGPWNYAENRQQFPYDDTPSYQVMADHLNGHGLVEDWGAGVGWLGRYIEGDYRAIDGAWSRWADAVVDLRTYTSDVPCAAMRHVLEHNGPEDWRAIATNFSRSWHVRAAVTFFIPPQPEDFDTSGEGWPVPDLAVSGPDLLEILGAHGTRFVDYVDLVYPPEDSIQWGWEGVLLMER